MLYARTMVFYITEHCDGSLKADGSNCGIFPLGSPTNSAGG